jgi:signal transduction histidine kinase
MPPDDCKGDILLVDDEADIRDVLVISLEDMGYRVIAAENAAEALRRFHDHPPDIVLTDIKMPGMDGIELLRNLKRENPETEVIMITGHGDMDLAVKSLKYEATDFITKPINVEGLEVAIQRARDRITMRRKLREYTQHLERLLKEKTELQDHLSSLGLMIGSISHGIKGLLTGLDGGMYLLDSGLRKENKEQVREGFDIIQMMVDRIRKMVLDILYYAKERELNWERVDALQFAGEVASALAPKIKEQGIRFDTRFSESAGTCEIDPAAVHSALFNLLENALDACLQDAGDKNGHTITFSVDRQDEDIRFSIADNGVGMDADTLGKIFDLFYSSKADKGTGFGLFLCQKIVHDHGGSITVDSAPGKGSVFTVRIPRLCESKGKTGEDGSSETP